MTAAPPFAGIRVLDLSTVIAGPMAGALLADQGADVIKIEEASIGDRGRYVGTSKGGISGFFHMANRGKRSIALDLKKPEDVELCRRLAATADVFLHNSRPGVMERLGLGYGDVRAVKPDIVYAAISGFGEEGPMAGAGAYDQILQCFAGVAALQGDSDGQPALIRTVLIDKICALYAAQAISAALYARRDGRGGQRVSISMVEAAAAFLWIDAAKTEALTDLDVVPQPTAAERCRLSRFADGWGTVAPTSDKAFIGMLRAFDIPMADDERLQTYVGRLRNPEALAQANRMWAEAAATMKTADVIARLEAADVPCSAVHSLAEFADHPQLAALGTFVETDHPRAGRIREPRPAARFSETPARVGGPAPDLDQDRTTILAELEAIERR